MFYTNRKIIDGGLVVQNIIIIRRPVPILLLYMNQFEWKLISLMAIYRIYVADVRRAIIEWNAFVATICSSCDVHFD